MKQDDGYKRCHAPSRTVPGVDPVIRIAVGRMAVLNRYQKRPVRCLASSCATGRLCAQRGRRASRSRGDGLGLRCRAGTPRGVPQFPAERSALRRPIHPCTHLRAGVRQGHRRGRRPRRGAVGYIATPGVISGRYRRTAHRSLHRDQHQLRPRRRGAPQHRKHARDRRFVPPVTLPPRPPRPAASDARRSTSPRSRRRVLHGRGPGRSRRASSLRNLGLDSTKSPPTPPSSSARSRWPSTPTWAATSWWRGTRPATTTSRTSSVADS